MDVYTYVEYHPNSTIDPLTTLIGSVGPTVKRVMRWQLGWSAPLIQSTPLLPQPWGEEIQV